MTPPPARADSQAPKVAVTTPAGGATVGGTISLNATASDDIGVKQVKWYVDGREVGWDDGAPWAASWNSSTAAAGEHKIFAKAADAAGNWGTSATVTFRVGTATTWTSTGGAWQLVTSDSFDGSSLDSTKWRIYNSAGHAGNGLRHPSAVSVGSGILNITARMVDGTLVSGGIASRHDLRYGRFEFRVRTDPDPSEATNGVVLTWPQSGNWPIDGENDIYETGTTAGRNPFKTFIHYGSTNRQHYFHHNADGTQWQWMAMEWSPSAIRIYRNGALVWTLQDTNAIPDVAHHLAIQLDAFKRTMTGVVRLQVDDVKVFRPA